MPALTASSASALMFSFIILSGMTACNPASASGSTQSSAVNSAIRWLTLNQTSTGSYGDYLEHWTAAAAYALWLNSSSSPAARAAFALLASEFDDETSGVWYEADVAGEVLYALAVGNNLGLLTNGSADYRRLLALQQQNGGFQGWFENGQTVTSSVDTAFALLGLVNARVSPASNQSAIGYLLKLQNPDGSFNLTSSTRSHELSSLGPEPVAISAVVTLALRDASYSNADTVSKALNFLRQAASENFGGHVYAAAVSALALNKYNMLDEASKAIAFLLAHQNTDGGFRDVIRTSENSNALDTGWAAIALQLVQPVSAQSPTLEPVIIMTIAVTAVAVAAIIAVLLMLSRKRGRMRPSVV